MFKSNITGPSPALFRQFEQAIRQKMETAALESSHQAGRIASSRIKQAMSGAGLGRLGNAVASTSDRDKTGRVHRHGTGAFSASSAIHLKSRSERAVGAIEAYTAGATIRPRSGGWLWIPSSELQRRVKGGKRVTPGNWASSGLEQRIGPLVKILGKHAGEVLLIVPAVTVRTTPGKKPSPLRLGKAGRIKAGRVLRENFVAFTGIRSTSRQARVDATQIIESLQAEMPALLSQALEK
jgi:hypothetical protein